MIHVERLEVKFYCKNSINIIDNVDQFQKQVEKVVLHFSSNRAKLSEIDNAVLPQIACHFLEVFMQMFSHQSRQQWYALEVASHTFPKPRGLEGCWLPMLV